MSIPTGFLSSWSEAARGEPRDTVVGALQSLLAVTEARLTKYEADVLKASGYHALVAGGTVSEWLVKGYPDPGIVALAVAAVGCAVGVFCLLPPKQKLLSMLDWLGITAPGQEVGEGGRGVRQVSQVVDEVSRVRSLRMHFLSLSCRIEKFFGFRMRILLFS